MLCEEITGRPMEWSLDDKIGPEIIFVHQRSWSIPRSLSGLGTKIYDGVVMTREIIAALQNRPRLRHL